MNTNVEKQLLLFRKELHKKYAERSGQEFKTAQRIRAYLKEHTSAEIHEVACTGTMAIYKGRHPGKAILLRADIDALPIKEINDFEHRSVDELMSHKCGHDGHTTILLAVMHLLEQQPLNKGIVMLLWQPAEENGMGAKAVTEDAFFRSLAIDEAYAMHNLPGYPLKQLLYKEGTFTANVKSLIIELEGKTAHAAEPEHGQNPAYTIADILAFVQTLIYNKPDEDDFFLITPVFMDAGSKDYGIAAGSGTLHLTIRSWLPEVFERQIQQLLEYINRICRAHEIGVSCSWTQEFWSNQNDAHAIRHIEQAGTELGLDMQKLKTPFKWGEDFGLFTQSIPGAMFGIGAGTDCPALHNPDYDYPDAITMTAAHMFYKILENAL